MATRITRKNVRYLAIGLACIIAVLGGKRFSGQVDPNEQILRQQAGFLKAAPVRVEPLDKAPARPVTVALADPEPAPPQPALDLGQAEYESPEQALAAISAADPSAAVVAQALALVTGEDDAPVPVQVTRAETSPVMQNLALPQPLGLPQSGLSVENEDDSARSGCMPGLDVTRAAGGMVQAVVAAPCHAGHSIILAHAGLAVDMLIPEDGRLRAPLPVLDSSQPFTATLDDG